MLQLIKFHITGVIGLAVKFLEAPQYSITCFMSEVTNLITIIGSRMAILDGGTKTFSITSKSQKITATPI